jgi:hypothetical protein
VKTAVVLLAALVLVSGAAAAQSPGRDADPEELWSEYPLTQTAPAAAPPTPTRAENGTEQPEQPASTRPGVIEAPANENRISGVAAIVALLAGALAVVTLVFFATRFVTDSFLLAVSATAKGVPAMSKLFRRRPNDEHPEAGDARPEGEPEGRQLADMVTSYTAYRSAVGTASSREAEPDAPPEEAAAEAAPEPVVQAAPEPEPEPEPPVVPARASRRDPEPEPSSAARYADLGQQIADVLRVAEEKAEQVLAEAHADAGRIREEAEAEATEARGRFELEIENDRTEAQRIRAEAEAYAEGRRLSADEEATAVRAEAESEARALREAGEEIRRRLEQEGLAKQNELRTASTTIEARLREALDTSRSVAADIERLLNGGPTVEPDEDDATLAEALELQQRRQ